MPRSSSDFDLAELGGLFTGLDSRTLQQLRSAATVRPAPAGAFLIKQGDAPNHLYVVASGCLKLGHVTPNGAQIAFGFRGRGELIGCVAVLRPMPYPASAKAVEDSVVLGWSSAQLHARFAEHPPLLRNALRIVCGQADEMMQRLRELTTEQVEQRVARALRRLPHGEGHAAGVPGATPRVSRQDLAEMTGATHFTVSRILSAWEEQGVIQSRRPRVIVRDAERLLAIAEGLQTLSRPRAPPAHGLDHRAE